MKRWIAVVLSAMLLCLFAVSSVSAAGPQMIVNEQPELPMYNALANVERLDGAEAADVMTKEGHPTAVLTAVSELDDVTAFLSLCLESGTLPTLIAETPEEGERVVEAMTAAYCKDVNVVSSQVPVLKNIRKNKSLVRTGLILDLPDGTLSSADAAAIRETVRSAPATFCVLSLSDASRQAVAELQELALAVWVRADDEASTSFEAATLRAVTSGANGIVTSDASKALGTMTAFLDSRSMTRTPIMIGHRGNPTQAPENSLSGFITAYENGADVFEIDVEITKDGEVIIMHDDTIARTTNYEGDERINRMTLEEIRSYRLLGKDGSVSDEPVPTLREVLEEFKDKDCRIFVEFKGSNEKNVAATAKLLKEYEMLDRVDVISFSNKLIQKTQAEMSGMSTGYLHSPVGSMKSYEHLLETLSTSLFGAQSLKSSVNPNKALINRDYMQAAAERGMTVWPWTYNAQTANSAFFLCPDGITTDDVQWTRDMVKYMTCEDTLAIGVGEERLPSVTVTTYGREETAVSEKELIVKIVDGDGCLTTENGRLKGVANGTATVLFGYEAKTKTGSPYVVYAQPVTVTVSSAAWLWWVGGGVLLLAAVVIVLVFVMKKCAKGDKK